MFVSIFDFNISSTLRKQGANNSAVILDKAYLTKLQEKNSDCIGAFCGYGVAVKDFKHPVIDFERNNTYIQSEGINQDFGVYDSPDELPKEHHQEISGIKALVVEIRSVVC